MRTMSYSGRGNGDLLVGLIFLGIIVIAAVSIGGAALFGNGGPHVPQATLSVTPTPISTPCNGTSQIETATVTAGNYANNTGFTVTFSSGAPSQMYVVGYHDNTQLAGFINTQPKGLYPGGIGTIQFRVFGKNIAGNRNPLNVTLNVTVYSNATTRTTGTSLPVTIGSC